MSNQSTTTLDFGAFPGSANASIPVGDINILVTSAVEAWIFPVSTTDHTADEHLVDPPRVYAGNISAGVGFTVYGFSQDENLVYGKWTVAWVWA